MNSEYVQNSFKENSIEQRKPMEELKRMNQPNSASANTLPQMMQPIVIQCDLPQAINKLTEQANGINWELEEIRNTLPELKTRIDLTPVQKSLTEMQRSLTEMNKLLERVGKLSEKYSCKWIRWLPDFSLLVALKWMVTDVYSHIMTDDRKNLAKKVNDQFLNKKMCPVHHRHSAYLRFRLFSCSKHHRNLQNRF